MVRLIVAGAFAAFVIAVPGLAEEKKADPPWAKVTTTGEIGGEGFDAGVSAVAGGTIRWVGPTPTGTRRVSATEIEVDGHFHLQLVRLTKSVFAVVWVEPDDERFAAARTSLKMGERRRNPSEREVWAAAVVCQAGDLERLTEGKEPTRVAVVGGVAAAHKDEPLARIAATGQVITITPARRKDFPAPGEAWVEGQLEAGKYAVGGGKTSTWAIRNGTNPIALVGKGVEGAGDLKGDVRVVGRLLVGPDRQLLLEVDELKPPKK